MSWILTVIIAAICGSVGARIAGARPLGCLTSIGVGFVGALVGRLLSQKLEVPDLVYLAGVPLGWTILGAAIFVALVMALTGRQRR